METRASDISPRCECWKVADTLSTEEDLPDHVCPDAAIASCHEWASVATGNEQPQREHGRWFREIEPDTLVQIDGGYDEWEAFNLTVWPLPLEGRSNAVYVILRQWAETAPEREWALTTGISDALDRAAIEIRELAEEVGFGCNVEDFSRMSQSVWLPKVASRHLALLGLSSTPATAFYAIWRACRGPREEAPIYPSRGLLVTSFCVGPGATASGTEVSDLQPAKDVRVSITGSSNWAGDAVYRKVAQKANAHRKWWQRQSGAQMLRADLRQRNGRGAGAELDGLVLRMRNGEISASESLAKAIEIKRPLRSRELEALRNRFYPSGHHRNGNH